MKVLGASTRRIRQKGQAIVFGLIFVGVIVLALLALFDQSQLVRSRVQIENAADAAAYSQAVHLARQLNFTAYTNRSMVANEVAIGHLVSLLSWSRQYQTLPKWLNTLSKYPPYNVVVIPPFGIQLHTLLRLFTAPLMVLGTGLDAMLTPTIQLQHFNSGLNSVLGIAQDLFVAVTVSAQAEALIRVVEEHDFDDQYDAPFVPTVGWFYMLFNYALTYAGDTFDLHGYHTRIGNALNASSGDPNASANADAVLSGFFGGASVDSSSLSASTMIRRNKGSADSIANYTHFAALVNDSLNPWSQQRQFFAKIGPTVPLVGYAAEFPPLIFRIGLMMEVGTFSDGGTALVFHTDGDDEAEGSPGWTSADATSLGAELSLQFYVRFYLELLFLTIDEILIDERFDLNEMLPFLDLGLPLSAATYQLWGKDQDAFQSAPPIGFKDPWPGGHYGEAMEGYRHLAMRTLGGAPNITAEMGYKPDPKCTPHSVWCNKDALGKKAGDSIRFHSLANGSNTSYELTAAVAKCMRDIGTSDNPDSLNINQPLGTGNPLTNYAVKNASQGETGVLNNTLRMYWSGNNDCQEDDNDYYDGSGALMTISSAEAYFAPFYRDEVASLLAPNWDARLKEPSELAIMLADGRISLENLIANFTPANGAKSVITLFMNSIATQINQRISDGASGLTDIPVVGSQLSTFESTLHDAVDDGATGVSSGLNEFIP